VLITKDKSAFELSQDSITNPRNPRKVVDIEELVRWTYQDQQADELTRRSGRGAWPSASLRSNLLTIERNGLIGTQIDGDGSLSYAHNDLDQDAEITHETICSVCEPLEVGLLIEHGRAGSRPDCFDGVQVKACAVMHRGRPLIEYLDPANKRKPIYCHVAYDPEPEHVEFVREIYVLWWDALSSLRSELEGKTGYEVIGPEVPRSPWIKNHVDNAGKV